MANNNNKDKCNVPHLRFPEFTGEWKKSTIGSLSTKVGSGVTPRGGETVYKSEGHSFVRSQNVGWGHLQLDDIAFIDKETHLRQKNTELQLDDVLLNITGASIGRSALVNKQIAGGNVNQHVCIIRTKDNLVPAFLCNFLLSNHGQKQIDSFQAGGNRQGLNFEQIRSIKITIPSTKEQTKIATLLHLIDERIATQNKIIEDLKKLKSAIIEKEYTHKTKSNSHIGDFIEQTSKRNKNRAIQNVLSVSNRQGFIQQSEQFENRSVASDDTSSYKIVKKNNFAFNPARINVGSIARLTTFDRGIVSPMYICFRTKDTLFPEYLDYYFETKQFFTEIQKRLEGSVRQCLSFEGLCNIPLCIPTIEVQQQVGKQLSTLVQEIKLEIDFLELLQRQKKFLLHQMFI